VGYSVVPRTVACEGMSALCSDASFPSKIKIRIHNMSACWKCKILKQHQVEVQYLRLENDLLHICILDEACYSNGMLPAVVFALWKKELCLLIF